MPLITAFTARNGYPATRTTVPQLFLILTSVSIIDHLHWLHLHALLALLRLHPHPHGDPGPQEGPAALRHLDVHGRGVAAAAAAAGPGLHGDEVLLVPAARLGGDDDDVLAVRGGGDGGGRGGGGGGVPLDGVAPGLAELLGLKGQGKMLKHGYFQECSMPKLL